jgi:predicted P-loop ATPase
LKGAQGLRKTQALKAMAPEIGGIATYRDLEIGSLLSDDTSARAIKGALVANLDELRQMARREKEEIKSALTRSTESYIPKFKESRQEFGRSCVIVATTNADEFLEDSTGLRRFYVLEVRSVVDVGWVRLNAEQLWAQGAAEFSATGIAWRNADRLSRPVTAQFEHFDERTAAMTDFIVQHNAGPLRITDVLERGLGIPAERQTKAIQMLTADAFKALDWKKVRRQEKGKGRSVWWESPDF